MGKNDNIDIDIVEEQITNKFIKKGAFYKATGISRQNYSNFKSQGYIPAKHAKKIADYLDVDIDYLLKNQDYYRKLETVNEDFRDNRYIELPTIYAGAGDEAFVVDMAQMISYPREIMPVEIDIDKNVLVIVVVGNSMEPLYYENDIVLIDMVNGREFMQVDGTYLVRYGNSVQIKDVTFLGNGDIMLSSRNTDVKIKPKADLGLEWEIIGKPYANFHPIIGSKLKVL